MDCKGKTIKPLDNNTKVYLPHFVIGKIFYKTEKSLPIEE